MLGFHGISVAPISALRPTSSNPVYNGSATLFCAASSVSTPGARRGAIGSVFAVATANPNSGKRGGGTGRVMASVKANGNSGKRNGGLGRILATIRANGNPGRRLGSISRVMIVARESGNPSRRFAALAKLIAATKFNSTGARIPPVIVEPAGKSIMRNKIRVLDNDRYSSRGVQFDGDNSFTVKLTQNEAGRLEIYYDHLLEAGDYVVSCVATISGETPPVISLNVAGTIATMIVSGGGFDREMTIVATTFNGLADEIKLCVRDYVRPRARPRDY